MPKNALASTDTQQQQWSSGAAATIARTKQIHSVKLFVFTLMNGPKVTKINTKHSQHVARKTLGRDAKTRCKKKYSDKTKPKK